MEWKKEVKILGVGAALLTLCSAQPTLAAEQTRGPLADGELFQSELVVETSRVLYAENATKTKNGVTSKTSNWAWHHDNGYPRGMHFAVFFNGKNLPDTAAVVKKTGGVPTKMEMENAARIRYATKDNENTMILYGTTGASAAGTDIAITSVELFGRLLNVTVALKDAEKNVPVTMNLIYPETAVPIALKKLPTYGNMRIRFADQQGHALQTIDVLMGR